MVRIHHNCPNTPLPLLLPLQRDIMFVDRIDQFINGIVFQIIPLQELMHHCKNALSKERKEMPLCLRPCIVIPEIWKYYYCTEEFLAIIDCRLPRVARHYSHLVAANIEVGTRSSFKNNRDIGTVSYLLCTDAKRERNNINELIYLMPVSDIFLCVL